MAELKVRWSSFAAGWHYVLAKPEAAELCRRCRGTGKRLKAVPAWGLSDEPCAECDGTGLR